MGRIKEMIRKATESPTKEQGYSPGGLGLGASQGGPPGPTTPVRPYRAVGNTTSPATGAQAGPGDRCRVIGYIPPSQQAFTPAIRFGKTSRG
jgi:hypothetical protein